VVGPKIHALRKAKGMTLQQVSDRSGLSVSFLSQVERDLASPTVISLAHIAHALGVGASFFLPPPPTGDTVVRSYDRQPFKLHDGEVVYARLGGDFGGRTLEPLLVTYPPRFASEVFRHEGEEFLYVLQGQVEIHLDDEAHSLHEGDSMHFASDRTHWVENLHDLPAQVVFVNTPTYID
jgi:transcriptional regulator with XRE-family HTH domain